MPEFDTIIKGGTVIDGLRSGRYQADVGIKDGRIASIGGLSASDGAKVLDAAGLIVAPGFVDLHTHYDSQVFWDPWCSISSWHGVTSVAIGNCGFGFAPCRPEDRERAMLAMSRNEAVPLKTMQAGMPWNWETFPEFMDVLQATPKGVNMLSYAPLAPIMMYVMGLETAKSRRPTPAELTAMTQLLEEAMEAGACGLSTQMLGATSHQRDYDGTPMVTDEMAVDDFLEFAKVLKKLHRGFIQGLGGSRDLWDKAAEVSGRPVLYNVVSVTTDQHGVATNNFREDLAWIHQSNLEGKRIFAQAQTCEVALEFTMEDWNLFDFSPIWREATLGSPAERLRKLSDPTTRAALRAEFDGGTKLGIVGHDGIPGVEVHFVERDDLKEKDYEGHTVAEIAAREQKHPIDAFLDLVIADNLHTTFGTPPRKFDMGAMKELATDPFAIPGISDGGAHTKFLTFGTYPTDYLTQLVRDNELMSLEDAHWHLSTLPAKAAGFQDRGFLAEGMPADILIYDFEGLKLGPKYRAWDYPADEWRLARKADGYRWIMVNGAVTFEDGECTGATPGALLRHGRA